MGVYSCPSLRIAEKQEQGKDKRRTFCPGLPKQTFSSPPPFFDFLDFSFIYFFWIFSFFFYLDLLSIASQTHFYLFIWTYSRSPVKLIFIFPSGLTLIASFIHLDLSPGANFIHLPGLASDCQFFSIFLTWTYL